MRTLGLIGGMTYHATALYYEQINQHVQKQLGGHNTAKIVMHSFNYADIITPFHAGDDAESIRLLCEAATNLKKVGAEALVLCVNTSHKWAAEIERAVGPSTPLLHIIDFSGAAARQAGMRRVAILGTRATMEGEFIRGRLEGGRFGLEVLVPEDVAVRDHMNDIIFRELPHNIVTEETRGLYLGAVRDLVARGAEGVILACTELQFVLKPGDVEVPLFDTVALHARGAAQWAIDN